MSKFHIISGLHGVQIALRYYSSDNDGNPFLTPDLVSDDEIDYAINRLKNELDLAAKAAKREIKRLKEKRASEGFPYPGRDSG